MVSKSRKDNASLAEIDALIGNQTFESSLYNYIVKTKNMDRSIEKVLNKTERTTYEDVIDNNFFGKELFIGNMEWLEYYGKSLNGLSIKKIENNEFIFKVFEHIRNIDYKDKVKTFTFRESNFIKLYFIHQKSIDAHFYEVMMKRNKDSIKEFMSKFTLKKIDNNEDAMRLLDWIIENCEKSTDDDIGKNILAEIRTALKEIEFKGEYSNIKDNFANLRAPKICIDKAKSYKRKIENQEETLKKQEQGK